MISYFNEILFGKGHTVFVGNRTIRTATFTCNVQELFLVTHTQKMALIS